LQSHLQLTVLIVAMTYQLNAGMLLLAAHAVSAVKKTMNIANEKKSGAGQGRMLLMILSMIFSWGQCKKFLQYMIIKLDPDYVEATA
jgi:hypothetical protein